MFQKRLWEDLYQGLGEEGPVNTQDRGQKVTVEGLQWTQGKLARAIGSRHCLSTGHT
jgi:hypothetical protein